MVPWVRRSARGIRAVAGPDALQLTTDVPLRGEGLTTEQYDPRARRQLGNFPQALSHIALVNSTCNLSQAGRSVRLRAGD